MKPSAAVIKQVLAGRTVILTPRGMWRSFPTRNWFQGENRYEVVAPNLKEFIVTYVEGQRPIVLSIKQ